MKRSVTLVLVSALIFITATAFIVKSSGGIVGRTGSPGETGCNGCHGGGAGVTQVSISSNPAFITNNYTPGQTYTIDVTVTNGAFSKFGFGCEILNTANANAGNMTTALTGVAFANFGTRKNAIQNTPKSGVGSASFQFVWVAPLSGTATIYAAGNAVNGTGSTSGDATGLTSMVLTPDLSMGINEAQKTGISAFSIFPNPIQSEFKLSYVLSESGMFSASLFDLQGKHITDLVNEDQLAGTHTVTARLSGEVSQGAYFLRSSLNGKAQLQRVLIVQ